MLGSQLWVKKIYLKIICIQQDQVPKKSQEIIVQ